MLIQYSVKNFLSFKNQATFSFLASNRKSNNPNIDIGATFDAAPDLRLLKCAVIYGANNSGKTSLIKSLRFIKNFIVNSSKESQVDEPIKVFPFLLSTETEKLPSEFEIIFLHKEYIYQYELSASRTAIVGEKLSRKKAEKGAASVTLFSRENDVIKVGRGFKEGRSLESKTRSNALFLSVCANFDGEISKLVLEWFARLRIVSGLSDTAMAFSARSLEDPVMGKKIANLLKVFDLGIDRYEKGEPRPPLDLTTKEFDELIEKQSLNKKFRLSITRQLPTRINSYHKVFSANGKHVRDIAFDLETDESAGTKKLVSLAGPIVDTLLSAYIMVIDEFDSKLHANITKTILDIFNSKEFNPLGAQLLAVTHDTNLLDGDHLRRDQIWFAGRNEIEGASLTSLIEYKVRNDVAFEKKYLEGDFGGVPFTRLGLLNKIHAERNESISAAEDIDEVDANEH